MPLHHREPLRRQAAGGERFWCTSRGCPGLEDKQPSGLTYQLQRALDGSDLEDREFVFGDLDEDCADLDCVGGDEKERLLLVPRWRL